MNDVLHAASKPLVIHWITEIFILVNYSGWNDSKQKNEHRHTHIRFKARSYKDWPKCPHLPKMSTVVNQLVLALTTVCSKYKYT